MTTTKSSDLAECDGQSLEQSRRFGSFPLAFQHARERRQEHQHQHHGEVLHDQPADGDFAAFGLEQASLLEHAEHNDGARDRKCDAENQSSAMAPTLPPGERHAERDSNQRLDQSARDGDGADRQEIIQRKVQADAEHQEDDADFRQLIGDVLVGDKARGERTDGDPGEEIADQRRQAQALHGKPQGEGKHEREDDG